MCSLRWLLCCSVGTGESRGGEDGRRAKIETLSINAVEHILSLSLHLQLLPPPKKKKIVRGLKNGLNLKAKGGVALIVCFTFQDVLHQTWILMPFFYSYEIHSDLICFCVSSQLKQSQQENTSLLRWCKEVAQRKQLPIFCERKLTG